MASEAELEGLFDRIQRYPGARIDFAPKRMGDGPARHCMFFEPGGIRMELAWVP